MIAFADELFDGQLLRTVGRCNYGGAELGECLAAAAEVGGADRERWLQAWTRLAERTLDAAESSLRGGHRVSARGAFLRASWLPHPNVGVSVLVGGPFYGATSSSYVVDLFTVGAGLTFRLARPGGADAAETADATP